MNKKSLATNLLVYMILALVVLLILLFIVQKINKQSSEGSISQICKQSLFLHDFSNLGRTVYNTDIKCPIEEVEIKYSDEEQIRAEIANHLYSAWDRFGQGKYNLFGPRNTIFCAISHTISFKHDDLQIEGLTNYLMTHYPQNEDITYYDYLASYDSSADSESLAQELSTTENSLGDIDTSKTYSIILVYSKGAEEIDSVLDTLSSATNVIAWIKGGELGADVAISGGQAIIRNREYQNAIGSIRNGNKIIANKATELRGFSHVTTPEDLTALANLEETSTQISRGLDAGEDVSGLISKLDESLELLEGAGGLSDEAIIITEEIIDVSDDVVRAADVAIKSTSKFKAVMTALPGHMMPVAADFAVAFGASTVVNSLADALQMYDEDWIAFLVFREHSQDNLLNLGCREVPISQE